jgi:hypothetical protein
MVVTEAQFKEWTRPRVMLFLSVDLENSTRLKQKDEPAKWVKLVAEFYSGFPRNFQAAREVAAPGWSLPAPVRVYPWKSLGDELVFAIEVADHRLPEREVLAFRKTLTDWNRTTANGTRLKGTAWLAGFPVANKLLPSPSSAKPDPSSHEQDFIGPSMDTGFRLGKTATCRRFVLSVELTWWLLQYGGTSGFPDATLHFQGCETHKGLAEETGYPLLWMAVEPSAYQGLEDELLGRVAYGNLEKLRQMTEKFILEFGTPRRLPFLRDRSQPDAEFEAELQREVELLRTILMVEEDPEGEASPEQQESQAEALLKELPGEESS